MRLNYINTATWWKNHIKSYGEKCRVIPPSFHILDCLFQGLERNQSGKDNPRLYCGIHSPSPLLISTKIEQRHFQRFPEPGVWNSSEKASGLSKIKPYIKKLSSFQQYPWGIAQAQAKLTLCWCQSWTWKEERHQNQNGGLKGPWGKAALPLMTGVGLTITNSSQNPKEISI